MAKQEQKEDAEGDPWLKKAAKKRQKEQEKATDKGDEEAEPSELKEALEKREKEIQELLASQEELTSLLKRVQADFENFKKRAERDSEHHTNFANASLVRKLLPLLDSIERSEEHPGSAEELLQGFKLIHAQLLDILKQEGLEKIDAKGSKFDPTRHEVLLKEHSEEPRNTILEELQRGYLFRDRVLRASKVRISSGPEGKKEKKEERDGNKKEE